MRTDWLSQLLNIAVCAGALGFASRVGQIGHNIANGPPSLRRFYGAALRSTVVLVYLDKAQK